MLRYKLAYGRQQVVRTFVQGTYDGKLEPPGQFIPVFGKLLAGAALTVQGYGQGLGAIHPYQLNFILHVGQQTAQVLEIFEKNPEGRVLQNHAFNIC